MNSFLQQYWSTFAPILLSGVALVISVRAWHKSRVIYAIEHKLYFSKPDSNGSNNNKELEKMLIRKVYNPACTRLWQLP